MDNRILVVDAFAAAPFTGNPAAVCLLDGERDDGWMQAVAAEMNLSETAFVRRLGHGQWSLRWFTPAVEVDLCGHATLASAHVLWNEQGESHDTLTFHTRSGELTAIREDERIVLDFPADLPAPASAPQALTGALGAAPEYIGRGRDDLLVVLSDVRSVRELTPDIHRLAALDARGVIVTAPGDDGSPYDFVSRFFAPRVGIPEDPVTGSAHCCLAPYWAERLGKVSLNAYQASKRGGEVGVRIAGGRVHLLGRGITMLRGSFHG